jgi:hypothetical protein
VRDVKGKTRTRVKRNGKWETVWVDAPVKPVNPREHSWGAAPVKAPVAVEPVKEVEPPIRAEIRELCESTALFLDLRRSSAGPAVKTPGQRSTHEQVRVKVTAWYGRYCVTRDEESDWWGWATLEA